MLLRSLLRGSCQPAFRIFHRARFPGEEKKIGNIGIRASLLHAWIIQLIPGFPFCAPRERKAKKPLYQKQKLDLTRKYYAYQTETKSRKPVYSHYGRNEWRGQPCFIRQIAKTGKSWIFDICEGDQIGKKISVVRMEKRTGTRIRSVLFAFLC